MSSLPVFFRIDSLLKFKVYALLKQAIKNGIMELDFHIGHL